MLEGLLTRSKTRTKLIERLRGLGAVKLTTPNGSTPAATKKQEYVKFLRSKKVDEMLSGRELEYCLQAICCLTEDEVMKNSSYLRKLLTTWFNKHYTPAKGPLADKLRRAICWVDEALNKGA